MTVCLWPRCARGPEGLICTYASPLFESKYAQMLPLQVRDVSATPFPRLVDLLLSLLQAWQTVRAPYALPGGTLSFLVGSPNLVCLAFSG